jgi:hypothetical protein
MSGEMAPSVHDPDRIIPETGNQTHAQDHQHAENQNRTEILDYDLKDWNSATRRATCNELVVAWAFDKAFESIPSRVVSLMSLHLNMLLTDISSANGW